MFSHSIRTFREKSMKRVGETDALGRASQPRSLGERKRTVAYTSRASAKTGLCSGGGRSAPARVRVWNGSDVDGPRAVARNWKAKAAFARWRLQSACLDLTAAQLAARIHAGAVMVFSLSMSIAW